MWARRNSSQIQFILLFTLVVALPFTASRALAQEEAAAGAVVEKARGSGT